MKFFQIACVIALSMTLVSCSTILGLDDKSPPKHDKLSKAHGGPKPSF